MHKNLKTYLLLFLIPALFSPLCSEEETDRTRSSRKPLSGTTAAGHPHLAITSKRIFPHIQKLCHEVMGGRKAGGAGARQASEYIAAYFRKIGLSPGGNAGSYFQTFKIRKGYHIDSSLEATRQGKTRIPFNRHADYMPLNSQGEVDITAECVITGYGISSNKLMIDDYAGRAVTGKAVIVFSGLPWPRDADPWLRKVDGRNLSSLKSKARTAQQHGSVLMIIVEDPAGWHSRLGGVEELMLPDTSFPLDCRIPVVNITRAAACRLTGLTPEELHRLAHCYKQQKEKDITLPESGKIHYTASIKGKARIGRNVLGVLPGRHPDLRRECIVIGAHYDHLGEGLEGVYFGANDNAAGVGAMLDIAAAFKGLRNRPRRTLVFIAFAAEEIGKLGSKYYATHPYLPIRDTTLMINFDMIGRNEKNHVYAVATRSSPELHHIHLKANKRTRLDITHPPSYRLGRSDHTAFYLAGVPVMYLFGGLHPGYHSVRDTVDQLVPEKIEKIARLAFLTALMVAERSRRITFIKEPPDSPAFYPPPRTRLPSVPNPATAAPGKKK